MNSKIIYIILLSISLFGNNIKIEIDKLNSNLPQKIDSFTTFEKVLYINNKIIFKKRLDSNRKEVKKLINDNEKWKMAKMKISFNEKFQNCKNDFMRKFLKDNNKLIIKYYGYDGDILIYIPIIYSDCNRFNLY